MNEKIELIRKNLVESFRDIKVEFFKKPKSSMWDRDSIIGLFERLEEGINFEFKRVLEIYNKY